MITIYFFAPDGLDSVQELLGSPLVTSHHYWLADTNKKETYGILSVSNSAHPIMIVNELEKAGIHVLPGLRDSSPVPSVIHSALSKHGVTATDTTHTVAKKMAKVSGITHLEPHLY